MERRESKKGAFLSQEEELSDGGGRGLLVRKLRGL